MTIYFLSNVGSNTPPYDTEVKAATTLATLTALPLTNADTVRASSTHTENTGASITYTLPTSAGLQLLSVTFNGAGTGGLAAGASITTGGNFSLTIRGFYYSSGFNFTVGAGGSSSSAQINLADSNATNHWQRYDNCSFYHNTTNASPSFNIGITSGSSSARDSTVIMKNCQFRFGNVAQKVAFRQCYANISGLSFHVSTVIPTNVFAPASNGVMAVVDVSDSEFGVLTNTALVDLSTGAPTRFSFRQCKFPSGFALTTGSPPSAGGTEVVMVDCDSGDIHYTYAKANSVGTVTQQNSIYADASDGTDNLGLTMVTNANASFLNPLQSPPLSYWNAALSAITTTVEAASNNVTFTDAELWQETLAKISSGSTLGTWEVSDRAASVLATPANQTTSTKTWTGVPGTPVKQKLVSGSFTPAEVGPIRVRVYLAKASATAYVSGKVG